MTPRLPLRLPSLAHPGDAQELDLRDEVCPYTFLKAKLALEPLAPGAVLRVLVGNAASARDVPRSLVDAGHAVVATELAGAGLWAITVRKRAACSLPRPETSPWFGRGRRSPLPRVEEDT